MKPLRLIAAPACLFGFVGLALCQTYKLEPNSARVQKGELSAKAAHQKALFWFKALQKDVTGYTLHLSLTTYGGKRDWYIVTEKNNKTTSNLSIEAMTGDLVYYRDTDIEQEMRSGSVAAGVGPKLSNQAYVTNIKRFLDRAGYRQPFSPIKVTVGSRGKPRAGAFIYELHKGIPVRYNNLSFSMRARDGVFDFVSRRWSTIRYNDEAKAEVTEAEAREIVRKAWKGKDKPVEVKLWYAQLRKDQPLSKNDIANLFYIARFANWGEVWVNAETGKVEFNGAPSRKGLSHSKAE